LYFLHNQYVSIFKRLTLQARITTLTLCLVAGSLFAQTQPGGGAEPTDALPNAPSYTQPAPIKAAFAPANTFVSPATAPYLPLSGREKFDHFVHCSYSPYTFLNAAYNATYAQIVGDPSGYGGGMEGWGKRMGSAVAGTEARSFFGWFLFPALLHQDPRYFPMYQGSVVKRGLYAISRVVVTRNDDGNVTFNSSGLLGIAFTESLQNAWLPQDRRGLGITVSRVAGSMQGYATTYLLQEFTPDIWRFVHRHAPKKLLRLEQKVPSRFSASFVSQP
jgi:hypothetical protein